MSAGGTDAKLKARLVDIVKARSFQSGKEVKLASGNTSTYYFNMKPTMLDAEGAHVIATLILAAIADLDADFIGGLEMGAVPLASAVAAVSHGGTKPVNAFFVRKQAKDHGTKSLIEGLPNGESLTRQARRRRRGCDDDRRLGHQGGGGAARRRRRGGRRRHRARPRGRRRRRLRRRRPDADARS